jgi:hypothetical protein
MTEQAERIQYLMDRTRIIDTIYRYATGIDNKDFVLCRSIFANEIKVDFSSYTGEVPGWTHLPADEWVARIVRVFDGIEATQHSMSNPVVEISGDVASCVMYMQAEHYLKNDQGDDFYTLGGYYTNDLARIDGDWKLTAVKVTVLWQRGNRHVMVLSESTN